MPRYIDADILKDLYQPIDGKDYNVNMAIIRANIDDIPTADVQEVIYCKNCKNYWKFENGAVVCEEFGGYIKDTDFCSRGAKMDRKD